MLDAQAILDAADALYTAERTRRQTRALTLKHPDMNMDDAYAVQRAWVDRKIADGDRITGYKIGLTSRAMQQAMRIDTPDFGILLESMFLPTTAALTPGIFAIRASKSNWALS